MAEGICTVPGCTKPRKHGRRYWCAGHSERQRLTGDVQADVPLRLSYPRGTSRIERLFDRVAITETCWLWTGYRNRMGYGQFGRNEPAHRVAYELLVGPIPDGLVLDHLCRNPPCVNPDHLEPVTNVENLQRGVGPSAQNARKARCKNGHEFTSENTYIRPDGGGRQCRRCAHARYVAAKSSRAA